MFDFEGHLKRQFNWSERTFGPPNGSKGVIDHIQQEIEEVKNDPKDLSEWIDIIILALDGAFREGYKPKEIITALVMKQLKNENRKWPDWRTAEPGKAINHIKETTA